MGISTQRRNRKIKEQEQKQEVKKTTKKKSK